MRDLGGNLLVKSELLEKGSPRDQEWSHKEQGDRDRHLWSPRELGEAPAERQGQQPGIVEAMMEIEETPIVSSASGKTLPRRAPSLVARLLNSAAVPCCGAQLKERNEKCQQICWTS